MSPNNPPNDFASPRHDIPLGVRRAQMALAIATPSRPIGYNLHSMEVAVGTKWTEDSIPDQAGTTVVITGANSGIGYDAALELARKGAHVVLACRSAEKGSAALDAIIHEVKDAKVELMSLDLADLSSIRAFASDFASKHSTVHTLINNAGVMALPYRKTADGFEMQFGTNHLGHFALTGLLLPTLMHGDPARIVTVSSQAHRLGKMHFDDLQWSRRYSKWPAYGQSKLANLLFAYELQRRLADLDSQVISVACHPGYASTHLQLAGPQMDGSRVWEWLNQTSNSLFAQSSKMGALPTLYAATDSEVQGGDYIGPSGIIEMAGHPKKVTSNARSHNTDDARRLWDVSVELTGVSYDALAPASSEA